MRPQAGSFLDKAARLYSGLPLGVQCGGREWRKFTNRTTGRTGWIASDGSVRRDDPADGPSGVIWLPVADIVADPGELQWRPFDGPDGLTESRRNDSRPFDPYHVPPISVWLRGSTWYVVDGFGRLRQARASGLPMIRAKVIQADSAAAAKEMGRALNLAQFDAVVPVDKPKPVNSDLSLAGTDGRELARLMAKSKGYAEDTFNRIMRAALRGYDGKGKLFDKADLKELAEMLAALRGSAELLGRSRVRERAQRIGSGDEPLSTFKEGDPSVLASPDEAVRYFTNLVPTLGIDPQRWAGEQRRRAFTLAASANQSLTERVQNIIAAGLKDNRSTADITNELSRNLTEAGVGRGGQYAEMVVRTNINDCFQTGAWEEAQHEDVKDIFPVWEYLGINDHRAGADHRPHFGRYYPRTATFHSVRGPRVYNCRCSLRWVDVYQWAEIQAAGGKVETSWAAMAV